MHTTKLSKLDLGFAWVNAAVFLFAAVWGTVPGLGNNPLAGLQRISANLLIAWPLALAVLSVAVTLSVRSWRTYERMLFMSGALACGWMVLSLYVSPGPATGLAFLAAILYRGRGSPGQNMSPSSSSFELFRNKRS